jgi:hypothetical protein
MEIKKIYQYIICLISLLIIMWGAVDSASAVLALLLPKSSYDVSMKNNVSTSPGAKNQEAVIDEFYQKRIMYDRLSDGLARIIMPACFFIYFSLKIKESERGA